LLCSFFALAQAPAPRQIANIEGITEYRLDNGLAVLLFPDAAASNVTVNLTVLVGSRHEGYGETGMAHLLEHMLFKGTPTHPDVPRDLRDHGAQFNGTTWVDRTNYFEMMAGTDENLAFAIALEADRLVNSRVRREDLMTEMTVVRNEFESGENDPETILKQRMMAAAYVWHNYGKPTIGNRSDIERVPIERLQAFYRKYYQPDNCVLIIAGKFEPSRALALVAENFGRLERPARRLDATYTEEPVQDGERIVTLRRVGKAGCVGAVYHIPAGPHEDCAPLEVLMHALVSEPSGRLYQALVASKKANSVSADVSTWHDPGLAELIAHVDPQQSVDDVRAVMIGLLEELPAKPLSVVEVERAKREILNQRELLITRSNSVGRILSEWAAMGDWRLFFLHRDRLAAVTTADIERVAAKYLLSSNRTVGLYYPTAAPVRATIPPTPAVEAVVKNYQGKQKIAAGEAFEPTTENIEARTVRGQLPIGLKMALLPKKTRGQTVRVQLTVHYGSEEALKGHTSATQFVAPLMQRGTSHQNRQQIRDRLSALGAQLRASGLLGEANFSLEVERPHLAEALDLLCEVLREPSFPAAELDVLKSETRAGLTKGLTEPTALAFREMQRRLNPYPATDVRYVPTIEESIARLDQVTATEVREIYQRQFGAESTDLAVVGDFDSVQVRELVQKRLGEWKAQVPYQRIPRPAQIDIPGGRQTILTPDKANALFAAGHSLAMSDSDQDFAALEIADFILGGSSLSSRLGDRIRQKEGLSYGVGSQFTADALDRSARFAIYAICNPINMERVDHDVGDELEKLLRMGIGRQELEDAKKAYLKETRVHRANDGYLATILAEELFNQRTFAYYAELERKIASLTAEQVTAAVRRHIVPQKLVIVHAGDFKKSVDGKP
jgi:zinc protease